MDMHGTEFGAAMQGRDGLAGIEQPGWIECGLDGMELIQFDAIELDAHLVDLLHADAVLSGDGAANLHAQLQDAATEFLGAFQLARFVAIEQDQRMQIAVAGVKHVRN